MLLDSHAYKYPAFASNTGVSFCLIHLFKRPDKGVRINVIPKHSGFFIFPDKIKGNFHDILQLVRCKECIWKATNNLS